MRSDPIEEYYRRKEEEARELAKKLKEARAANADPKLIAELQRKLDLAYYVGD